MPASTAGFHAIDGSISSTPDLFFELFFEF